MERKTIGGFIAALRKANGMTQKDLADRLNVSDKTVSRWEQDNGAPDLSLIPVIAEIFDVTCDELLRGERKSPEQRMEPAEEQATSPKAEKQRQRLLTVSLSKYKTRTYIAMGLSVAGLIAAMICNLGFLRAIIGFFVAAVFYLASIVCQAVFVNGALLSVSDESLTAAEMGRFKRTVIRLAQRSIGLTVVLFAISLPLVVFSYDAYIGLTASSWLSYGLTFGVLTLVILCVVYWFLNASLLKKGAYSLPEQEERVWRSNHKLQRKCATILVIVLLVTGIVQVLVTTIWDAYALSEGTEFHDYESFVEFMEQDIPYSSYDFSWDGTVSTPNASVREETTYYDQFGNEISEEDALKIKLRIYDGTEEGKVVCEYIDRNQSVASISYTQTGESLLPITVITFRQLAGGQAKYNIINAAFVALYCLEIAAAFVVYFKKRVR